MKRPDVISSLHQILTDVVATSGIKGRAYTATLLSMRGAVVRPRGEGGEMTQAERLLLSAQEIDLLKKFYDATTLEELVTEQAHHIEKLQGKLPPLIDREPRNYRRGGE